MTDFLHFGPAVRRIFAGPGGVVVTDARGARTPLALDQRVLVFGGSLMMVGRPPLTRHLRRLWRRWRGARSRQARHFIKTRLRMEQTTRSNSSEPTSDDPMVKLATVLVAGGIGQGMADGRGLIYEIAAHEGSHALVELVLGTPAEKLKVFVEAKGGWVRGWVSCGGTPEGEQMPRPSDDERLPGLSEAQIAYGLPPLDLAAIRRTAEGILREHWLFVLTVAQRLEEKLKMHGEEARIDGDELSWMWMFYQIRRGE